MDAYNPFAAVQKQVDRCADILMLDPSVRDILRVPKREIQVSLPVSMDDGSVRVFQGFRVQYNDAAGPAEGGIRFHPNETMDTVRALAAWMTWKCALLNLPLGGGQGGIACNPKDMSLGELERLSRAYVRAVYDVIGPEKDILAPDVNTDPQTMAWMMDEYCSLSGRNQFGVVAGKPLALGGSEGRSDATARGGLCTVREAARELGFDLRNATFAIRGYGNVGYYAAALAVELFGSTIVALSDSRGGIHNDKGLDLDAVCEHKARTGSVAKFAGAEPITSEELLELDVDVFVPAGLESVINDANAPNVKSRIVAEMANGPTTPEADEILSEKGIHVVPDFLCNAGGVTVSYFERVQNASMYYWDRETVHARLDKKMTAAYHSVLAASKEYKIDMRQAAYVLAVRRIIEAMQLRGWV